MIDRDGIRQRWQAVGGTLDERGQRLFAAAEVRAAGHGGLKAVSEITGLARSTINRGEDDLDREPLAAGRIRRWLAKTGGEFSKLCGELEVGDLSQQYSSAICKKRRSAAASFELAKFGHGTVILVPIFTGEMTCTFVMLPRRRPTPVLDGDPFVGPP